MSICTHSYLLFDGALLHDIALRDRILEAPDIRLLYEDEGPQAARVGPLLLPAYQSVVRLMNQLSAGNPEVMFGYGVLRGSVPMEQVLQHLRQLRFIHASSGKRYYFRFADGRAFSNVWQTLSSEQRRAVLGPVQAWHHHDMAGRECCARQDPVRSAHSGDSLPLHLQSEQWHRMLKASRVGELFLAASRANHRIPAQGTGGQRLDWAAQVHERLQRLQMHDVAVKISAVLVVWQTAAQVLHDDRFEAALRQASRSGDVSGILAFGPASSTQGAS